MLTLLSSLTLTSNMRHKDSFKHRKKKWRNHSPLHCNSKWKCSSIGIRSSEMLGSQHCIISFMFNIYTKLPSFLHLYCLEQVGCVFASLISSKKISEITCILYLQFYILAKSFLFPREAHHSLWTMTGQCMSAFRAGRTWLQSFQRPLLFFLLFFKTGIL